MSHKKSLYLILSFCLIISFSMVTYAVSPISYIPLETDSSILQLNDKFAPALSTFDNSLSLVDTEATSIDFIANLTAAGDAYDSLMKSFYQSQPDAQKYNPNVYTVSGITEDGFPDVYAGAYINRDLNLVVMLTEDSIANARSLSAGENTILRATGTDELIFSSAEFSYSTLVSLMDDVYQYLKTGRNGKDGFYIVHFALDDYNNRVLVGLSSNTVACRTAFESIIGNSAAFTFETANAAGYELTSSLNPGSGFAGGSAGFRAKAYTMRGYVYGFVTAAHCATPGFPVYDSNNNIIGTASRTLYQQEGNIDAVFVETKMDFGQIIQNSGGEILKSGIDANLAQGHPIAKSGKKTGNTTGTVLYISEGFGWDDVIYSDFAVSDYSCDNGDSGGIVYSTRTGSNWIAGICQGRYAVFKDEKVRAFFCKAVNITPAFNLSLY